MLVAGFEGSIICSEPSAIMLPEILEDALKIGFTRDRGLIERVLGLIRSRLVPVPYVQWRSGCAPFAVTAGAGVFGIRPR